VSLYRAAATERRSELGSYRQANALRLGVSADAITSVDRDAPFVSQHGHRVG